MDPITIATGILGLLGTAAAVIKFLDSAKSAIENAPKTISWALAEVTDVHSTIARLHGLFEHIQSVPEAARALVGLQDAVVAVLELMSSFDHLVHILGPFGVKDPALLKTWDKAKWALKQEDVARAIVRIQTHKGSLTLMLNILQCESDVVALESRAALENGINALIEGSTATQQRLERIERLFMACLEDPSNAIGKLKSGARGADVLSIRSTTVKVRVSTALQAPEPPACPPANLPPAAETAEMTQGVPSFRLEYEETLAESGVYRRVSRPFDNFSILSGDDHSVARTVMTTYSLADNASVLSTYPILDRANLRHPEFYAEGDDKSNQPMRWHLNPVTARRRISSGSQSTSQNSVSKIKLQAPPNCGEDVMGPWHLTVRRIWRPTKLRFEVQFDTPVIFVSPPVNKRGPLHNTAIHYMDGTAVSMKATRVLSLDAEEQMRTEYARATPDNSIATWFILISHIHAMEKASWEWWRLHYNEHYDDSFHPGSVGHFAKGSSLCVGLQAKRRSWDDIPGGVKKPYATTTISHMIEIAAMMGIYWKVFDRSTDRYRAEGNGYLLTGTQTDDLGLMFNFQLTGGHRFQENRVIPVHEVKELCCGFVSTIFRLDIDSRRLGMLKEDPQDLDLLKLGSFNEIAESLALIGCNAITVGYIRNLEAKHGHLFPIPFELIGMLGMTLRIRNTPFRALPNPTPYRWESVFFNFEELIREYSGRIKSLEGLDAFRKLEEASQTVFGALLDNKRSRETLNLELVSAQHLSRSEGFRFKLQPSSHRSKPEYSMKLLEILHDALDKCDSYLKSEEFNLVRCVLREHIQVVLKQVNENENNGDEEKERLPSSDKRQGRPFDEVLAASPEDRQKTFIDMYFDHVLYEVKGRAANSFHRMNSRGNTTSPLPGVTLPVPEATPDADADGTSTGDNARYIESRAAAVWCTLVLRMLCWLVLHNFDKDDLQIPKSELFGSRMAVYIS